MRNKQDDHLLGFDTQDPEQFQALIHRLKDELAAGKTVKEALQLNPAELETIYSLAYQRYQLGEYQNACDLFRYLLLLDNTSFKAILGAAASFDRLKKYEEAANHYLLASFYDPKNPVPYFHGALCFLQLGNGQMATNGLAIAIDLAGETAEYAQLKERAKLVKKNLNENQQNKDQA